MKKLPGFAKQTSVIAVTARWVFVLAFAAPLGSTQRLAAEQPPLPAAEAPGFAPIISSKDAVKGERFYPAPAPIEQGHPAFEPGVHAYESGSPAFGPGEHVFEPDAHKEGHFFESGPFGYGEYPTDFGQGCAPSWRFRVEWLEFRPHESGKSLSNEILFDDFSYQEGARLTIDRKYDCTQGWELVYMGPFEWSEETRTSAPGTLNFTPGGSNVDLSAFNGADRHRHRLETDLDSFEALYKSWGWDVIAVSCGWRYLDIDEQLTFRSVDANGDRGALLIDTSNDLFGFQVGLDLLLPIDRWSFDSTMKGGLYANLAESSVFLRNAGITEANNEEEEIEFAATIEGGAYLRYFLTPRLTARVGYEYLWVYGLAKADEQFGRRIKRSTGTRVDGNGDIFYHGATAGFEFVW